MTSEIGTNLSEACELLIQGFPVGVPTETVYGLAANALDPEAVAGIFDVKSRPKFDPLIVHFRSMDRAKQYVSTFPEWAEQLATTFWPGPLTLVLPKADSIPDIVTSGNSTVGVRVPNHPMLLELLGGLDFPIAAPSANKFGMVSPTTAQHVFAQLGDKIPYILDGGPCQVGIESTVIGEKDGHPTILRMGGISVESIEQQIGKVQVSTHSSSKPESPGQLTRHYAPSRRLFIGEPDLERYVRSKVGAIRFMEFDKRLFERQQVILAPNGDLKLAAQNLFSALRTFDDSSVRAVWAELVPEEGLGRAINDRLRRAAASRY